VAADQYREFTSKPNFPEVVVHLARDALNGWRGEHEDRDEGVALAGILADALADQDYPELSQHFRGRDHSGRGKGCWALHLLTGNLTDFNLVGTTARRWLRVSAWKFRELAKRYGLAARDRLTIRGTSYRYYDAAAVLRLADRLGRERSAVLSPYYPRVRRQNGRWLLLFREGWAYPLTPPDQSDAAARLLGTVGKLVSAGFDAAFIGRAVERIAAAFGWDVGDVGEEDEGDW
jgi:hypothetical protein